MENNEQMYKLIDSGDKRRLEEFAGYIVDRPDPEAIWVKENLKIWKKADALFLNNWKVIKKPPKNWVIEMEDIKLGLKLTPFKHTGAFPEQTWQWKAIQDLISRSNKKDINILNLFGYTGGASLAAAKVGARVTQVDASRPSLSWFKENQKLNNLENSPIRIIPDDALKFSQREIKRGNKYDGVVMDPPVYGHGPKGEKWDFKKDFPTLLKNVSMLLSPNPLFVIVNAYAVSTSPTTLKNIFEDEFKKFKGNISSGELFLEESNSRKRKLTTGIFAFWRH